ncbi:DUF951 domain-containing protein [Paenibacillus turpanensis]|uniref:DUF951 domain-containing protein n=1 Tax=Paenibacillus turpanensis TaxID=2689078 RepID=UPI00140E2601|nr:DUF951 domain-containing protein [Paenibacillus turpanensis]
MEPKQFGLGDMVVMKKPHPCGTNEMQIIRMGMDIRIKCTGCQHSVLIPRSKFEKKLKKIVRHATDEEKKALML